MASENQLRSAVIKWGGLLLYIAAFWGFGDKVYLAYSNQFDLIKRKKEDYFFIPVLTKYV